MTTSVADMEILKEIPGYKAIMKAVLKTQIQLLVEQLSDHTGEESVVLTASVNDGSLSHLGSSTGKGFLEGRDEIKSQFLGYCLKSHHKRKTQESPAPYQRSNVSHPGPRSSGQQSAKRPRLHPVSLSRISADSEVPVMLPDQRSTDTSGEAVYTSTPARSQRGSISESLSGPPRTLSSDSATNIKLEQSSGMLENDDTGQQRDTGTDFMTPASLPSSIGLSHTQTTESVSQRDSEKDKTHIEGESGQDSPNIKVEPEGESELDLEITGIELGDSTSQGSSENWGQNVSSGAVGYETGASGDSSFQQSENQAGYIIPSIGMEKDLEAVVQDFIYRSQDDGEERKPAEIASEYSSMDDRSYFEDPSACRNVECLEEKGLDSSWLLRQEVNNVFMPGSPLVQETVASIEKDTYDIEETKNVDEERNVNGLNFKNSNNLAIVRESEKPDKGIGLPCKDTLSSPKRPVGRPRKYVKLPAYLEGKHTETKQGQIRTFCDKSEALVKERLPSNILRKDFFHPAKEFDFIGQESEEVSGVIELVNASEDTGQKNNTVKDTQLHQGKDVFIEKTVGKQRKYPLWTSGTSVGHQEEIGKKRPVGRPRKYPVQGQDGVKSPEGFKRRVGRPRKYPFNRSLNVGPLRKSTSVIESCLEDSADFIREKDIASNKTLVVVVDDILTRSSDEDYNSTVEGIGGTASTENVQKASSHLRGRRLKIAGDHLGLTAKQSPKYIHYPKEKRGEILEVAKRIGKKDAAMNYGISVSTIVSWQKQMEKIDGDKGGNKMSRGRKRTLGNELELKILDWVVQQTEQNITVNSEMIKSYTLSVVCEKYPQFKASDTWVRAFMERNFLNFTK